MKDKIQAILVDYGADTIAFMSKQLTQEQREQKRDQATNAILELVVEELQNIPISGLRVKRLREQGMGWQEIGNKLGMSRQSAYIFANRTGKIEQFIQDRISKLRQ